MARYPTLLVSLACGLAVLASVVGCTGSSSTPEATFVPESKPTRRVATDESWHECLSEAMKLWDEAEAAFVQARQHSQDDLRREDCDAPLQIMENYILAKKGMSACPLPSNPEMREVDRLFHEAVSEQTRASDYFVTWCFAPAEEEDFIREMMMLHWNKGRILSHEAVELYKSLIQTPTADPDLDYLGAVRDTVMPLYEQSQGTFDELMPLLDADVASFCELVPEWQSQVEWTYEALVSCPDPSHAALLDAQDLWLESLAEAAMASHWMRQFCDTNNMEYLDYAWARLDESNKLADEYWAIWDSYWD